MAPGLWAYLLSLLAIICTSSAMNVNRPPGRWARNEQFDDGWRGSLGPFDPLREPAARRTQDEILFQPLLLTEPIIPTTAAAAGGEGGGFYELVVGRKSSQSDSSQAVASAFGSPDVIIGRVIPSDDANIETAAAVSSLTTEAIAGQSHYNSEIEDITTDGTDAVTVTQQQQQQLLKKTDLLLPPGSFYLPAVSRHMGEYYSQSEQAIYIPLARPSAPHQDSLFPVSTQVVLVDHKLPQGQQRNQRQPTAASFENVAEDSDGDDTVEEEDEEEDSVSLSSDENVETEVVDSARRPPSSSVPTRGKLQPDLVMTLYPNLSNLLPQSSIRNLGVKSFPNENVKTPNHSGVSSVIHDAKIVTPPHGYLPSTQANNKPKSAQASVQQQHSQRPQRLASKPNLLNVAAQPSSSTHVAQASNTKATVKSPFKGIVYTPFTPDDISPLNYLSPAQVFESFRSVPSPPSSAFDQVSAPSFTVFQQATIGTPNFPSAKSMDFTWNVSDTNFLPRPSSTQQPLPPTTATSSPITNNATALIQTNIPVVQQQQQLFKLHEDNTPREVVVRTKFSAANLDRPDSSSFVINSSSSNSDSSDIEIITGYFDDLSGEGTKSGATYDIVPQLVRGNHEETVVAPQNHLQPQVSDTASEASVAYSIVVQPDIPVVSEAASSTEPTTITSSEPPILHGNFQPMLESTASDQNQPLVPSSPIRITEKDALLFVENSNDSGEFAAKLKPDHKFFIEEKHRVAESQIHQTLHREESQPEVQAINHKVSEKQGSLAPRHYYYKAGQISPKGAVYSVTQGHSKVKFFGFNALHLGGDDGSDGELLKQPDGKYPLFYSNYQLPGGWSPYSLIASSPPPTPTFKVVPKKSVPIKSKSSIRPVHFVKRPGTAEEIEASDTSSIAISDPYEYHQHLQKMANEDRLPTSTTPNLS